LTKIDNIIHGKYPMLSGKELVKILCNHFMFQIINNNGSHCTLINEQINPPILLQVYLHKELKRGSLSSIIANANINRFDFLKSV
jgi:predicted RNA binding protein YcfA (HicA-like mRNA interferase family)